MCVCVCLWLRSRVRVQPEDKVHCRARCAVCLGSHNRNLPQQPSQSPIGSIRGVAIARLVPDTRQSNIRFPLNNSFVGASLPRMLTPSIVSQQNVATPLAETLEIVLPDQRRRRFFWINLARAAPGKRAQSGDRGVRCRAVNVQLWSLQTGNVCREHTKDSLHVGCYRCCLDSTTIGLLIDDTPVGMFGCLVLLVCCWLRPTGGE